MTDVMDEHLVLVVVIVTDRVVELIYISPDGGMHREFYAVHSLEGESYIRYVQLTPVFKRVYNDVCTIYIREGSQNE